MKFVSEKDVSVGEMFDLLLIDNERGRTVFSCDAVFDRNVFLAAA